MVLEWFNAEDAVQFGHEIAQQAQLLFPPTPIERQVKTTKKDQKKLDSLIARTRTFAQQHKLNLYKKAKLLNTLKWDMREAGYRGPIIDEIIVLLTPLLSQ